MHVGNQEVLCDVFCLGTFSVYSVLFEYDFPGSLGDVKTDLSNLRSGEVKTVGSGRGSHSSLDNGKFLVYETSVSLDIK